MFRIQRRIPIQELQTVVPGSRRGLRLNDPASLLKRGPLDYSADNQINAINWSAETSQRSLVHALSREYVSGGSRTHGGTESWEKKNERDREREREKA